MIKLTNGNSSLRNGGSAPLDQAMNNTETGVELTMTCQILNAHDPSQDAQHLALHFELSEENN